MEPSSLDQSQSPKQKHPLFQITPLSKYLAMVLFVFMPFIGGYVGYTFAPEEKVVEVSRSVNTFDEERGNKAEIVSDVTSERVPLTIDAIINDREYWKEKFNIPHTESIFSPKNELVPTTFQLYQDNGISLLIPYNEGLGYPYYRLPAYEQIENGIYFYGGGGGGGVIHLYPADSLTSTIAEIESDNGNKCNPFTVNSTITGVWCQYFEMQKPDKTYDELFIQGTKNVYGFTFYSVSEEERAVIYKSIIVE